MHVGMGVIFQGEGEGRTDRNVYRNELRFGDLAEPLGFESLWGVEHHFTDYTMCPDVLQYLTYFAGRTQQHPARLDGGRPAVARSDARRRAGRDARPHVERTLHLRHRPRPRPRRVRGLRRQPGGQPRDLRRGGADDPRGPRARLLRVRRQVREAGAPRASARGRSSRSAGGPTPRRCRPSRPRSWRGSASAS